MTDFEEIYIEHFSDVYKYVLTMCRNEAVAEEVAQETFFKAMENINQFNGSCKLFVWLCQIAKNTYFSHSNKQKRIVTEVDLDFPDETTDLENDYFDKEMAKKLHVLIHNLNEPAKEVFTLRVFGELPFSQIAELFGKTESWARLVYYRAKKKLQEGIK